MLKTFGASLEAPAPLNKEFEQERSRQRRLGSWFLDPGAIHHRALVLGLAAEQQSDLFGW